jgi:serine/threonine protein kinase
MSIATIPALIEAIRQDHLLEAEQLEELTSSLQTRIPEPRALAQELLRRGWLTSYQVNLLLQGRRGELTLGPYLLLARLGGGGMGRVFKARHRRVGRVVAVKVLSGEQLRDPEALRRFHREIEATAKLSHPNAVFAYDADQLGDSHLIEMEYVEGTDLARLVQERGPLPVAETCDYVCQAALGLQHAHEQGLVHRNIKPSNLLLAHPQAADRGTSNGGPASGGRGGVIKVLDMGLARLQWTMGDEGSRTVLKEGAVMGTPDYMAPEQAVRPHEVDIRADLYSLGCTFYLLLTGQAPFPGGSLAEKLLKHQSEEPVPVERLRPEVSPEVAAVVHRLMAKRPEQRYQSPAELIAALSALPSSAGVPVPCPLAPSPVANPTEARDGVASPFASPVAEPIGRRRVMRPPRKGKWRLGLLITGAVALVAVGVTTAVVALFSGGGPSQTAAPHADTRRPRRDGVSQPARLFADDFNGNALGSAWRHSAWASGGGPESVTFSGGILSLVGAEVRSIRTYSDTAVEARVQFGAAPHQHFGLATGLDPVPSVSWALFSTGSTTDTLLARINADGDTKDVSIGALPDGFHDYLIKPVGDGFQFSVDGTVRATVAAKVPRASAMKIVFSAFNGPPAPPLRADWVRIPSRTPSGSGTKRSSRP